MSAAGASPRILLPPEGEAARLYELDASRRRGGYTALQQALALGPAEVVARVKASGLRGRGGAGFPAGTKWEFVSKAPDPVRYIVCNANEDEPGTFKDRVLMEQNPHLVLEGMALAGYAAGAREGYLYLRSEYVRSRERLRRALDDAAAAGLLGDRVLGSEFSFRIHLFIGAGAYVCGEETALLESLEGRRGEPRLKPPFPTQAGLWNRPTVINNVETLASVPFIVREGPDAYQALGRDGQAGTKIYCLSGEVARPGAYELPMGATARELIFDHGGGIGDGRSLKAFAPGGAASGFLPAGKVDVPLSYEALANEGSMLGPGAVIAVSDRACMVDVALNLLRFFARESCGKCTPCRVGTEKLVTLVEGVQQGRGEPGVFSLIQELGPQMGLASICGLGQTAYNPVTTGLRWFREEFDAHLVGRCPAGVCVR